MESRGQGTHSRQHSEENPLEPQLWPHLKQPEEGGRARAAPLDQKGSPNHAPRIPSWRAKRNPLAYLEKLPPKFQRKVLSSP